MPAVGSLRPKVLLLGSMPGEASLRKGEYYAHPQNQFWKILFALYQPGMPVPQDYAQRIGLLEANGILVWDVLHRCKRLGSADDSITEEEINNFEHFFQSHTTIALIAFNGKKAANAFPCKQFPQYQYAVLPSTSPANAQYSFDAKLQAWQKVLIDSHIR